MTTIPIKIGSEHAKEPEDVFGAKVLELEKNQTPELRTKIREMALSRTEISYLFERMEIICTKNNDENGEFIDTEYFVSKDNKRYWVYHQETGLEDSEFVKAGFFDELCGEMQIGESRLFLSDTMIPFSLEKMIVYDEPEICAVPIDSVEFYAMVLGSYNFLVEEQNKFWEAILVSIGVDTKKAFNAKRLIKECYNYNITAADKAAPYLMEEARHIETFSRLMYDVVWEGNIDGKLKDGIDFIAAGTRGFYDFDSRLKVIRKQHEKLKKQLKKFSKSKYVTKLEELYVETKAILPALSHGKVSLKPYLLIRQARLYNEVRATYNKYCKKSEEDYKSPEDQNKPRNHSTFSMQDLARL